MKYASCDRVSSVAGFLEFCSYIAAGVSMAVSGITAELIGWSGVILLWLAVMVIGLLSLLAARKMNRKLEEIPQ